MLHSWAGRFRDGLEIMAIQKVAETAPDRPAIIMSQSGAALSFADLDAKSARLAAALRARGLRAGDRLAILLENRCEYLIAAWAGRRSGLRMVPVNWHLTAAEAGYVVGNSDAAAIVTSDALADLTRQVSAVAPMLVAKINVDGARDGFEGLGAMLSAVDPLPLSESRQGSLMAYSSGTSGRPKGILRPVADAPFGDLIAFEQMLARTYGFDDRTVYLNPAPLYHTAPIGWSMATQALGGAVVVMERFDPEAALAAIARYRVTHAQFVPTHFIRMLKLPLEVRRRYDLSSLRFVVHSAAPCPAEVKAQMIDWWGPIIYEYYAGSEGGGFVGLDSVEWLAHRGSVGRAIGGLSAGVKGAIHIVDPETNEEAAPGAIGQIYFEDVERFEYHKDPGQTDQFFNAQGWGTLGDMGWLDADGYLYLADRKSHMIISGGVNIYPQEIEAALALHPAVFDVAVIGAPNDEYGEEVKAVVQPAGPAGPELAETLMAYCRTRLAGYKCPRSVDFVDQLPRLPNGKLLKRQLRDRYWPEGLVKI
jgi:long-chain acyl-CoA synthetase